MPYGENLEVSEELMPEDLNRFDLSIWRKKMFEEIGKVDYSTYPLPDDIDLFCPICWAILADSELDNYSIGVYYRLALLERFHCSWKDIYNYGAKENTDKAIEKLLDLHYLQKNENEDIQVLYIF